MPADLSQQPDRPAPRDPARPAQGPAQPARRSQLVDPPPPRDAAPIEQDEWAYLVP